MADQMQLFLNEFMLDVGQDPFLILTAILGLVTLVVAVSGTVLETRTNTGGLSKGGFLCCGFLILASAGEVLLSYADERKEERRRAQIVDEIEGSMAIMFEEYATAIDEAKDAEAELQAAHARGASGEELEMCASRLDEAYQGLRKFESRWTNGDEDEDEGRRAPRAIRTNRGGAVKVRIPRNVRTMIDRQGTSLKSQRIAIGHRTELPEGFERLSPDEMRSTLKARGLWEGNGNGGNGRPPRNGNNGNSNE